MRKKAEYKGCELASPLYRQIVAEKMKSSNKQVIINQGTKAGKNKLYE
jgi:hypothetical protein